MVSKSRFTATFKMSLKIRQADGLKKSHPERGLELVNEILRQDPNNPVALGIKTECLLNIGQPKEALRYALQNVKASGNEVSYGLLYLVYSHLRMFPEALEAAEKSATIAPGSEISRRQLRRALLQYRLRRLVESASAEATSAITAKALHDLAWKEAHSGEFDQALEHIVEACEIDSGEIQHRNLLQEILRLKAKTRRRTQ